MTWIFAALIMIEAAHLAAPVVLAWSNVGFRQRLVLPHLWQFLGLPTVVLGAALMLPLSVVAPVYFVANMHHFGMQNFGVLSLCRRLHHRRIWMGVCLVGTAALMEVPLVGFLVGVVHWLTDIGLSSAASRYAPAFIAVLLVGGLAGFIWLIPTDHGVKRRSVELIVTARMGLGFVHFLYSRWVWQFSNPVVRSTIGGFVNA